MMMMIMVMMIRRKVGSIGGNAIYGIKATEMFPIKAEASAESREKKTSFEQIWYAHTTSQSI
jgi:hypothetical protein